MRRAVEGLSVSPDLLMIDGNRAKGFDKPVVTVVKGDGKIPVIAAASILAKVSRDRYCLEMDEKYPEYNFKKHKGYGTKEHIENLKKFGKCEIHRDTFIKKFV